MRSLPSCVFILGFIAAFGGIDFLSPDKDGLRYSHLETAVYLPPLTRYPRPPGASRQTLDTSPSFFEGDGDLVLTPSRILSAEIYIRKQPAANGKVASRYLVLVLILCPSPCRAAKAPPQVGP